MQKLSQTSDGAYMCNLSSKLRSINQQEISPYPLWHHASICKYLWKTLSRTRSYSSN
jgi:hypothetical protein